MVADEPVACGGGGLKESPSVDSRIPDVPKMADWRNPPAPVMKLMVPPFGDSVHTLKGRWTLAYLKRGMSQ
jgi:hypothetical protein